MHSQTKVNNLVTVEVRRKVTVFRQGEHVVHPRHGIGNIERIEDKGLSGRNYVIALPFARVSRMRVPVDTARAEGLRSVVDPDEIDCVLDYMRMHFVNTEVKGIDWITKYRDNCEKIKSGDLYQIAEVLKFLHVRFRDTPEKLENDEVYFFARDMLSSEMVYAKKMSKESADELIEDILMNSF